MPTGDTLRINTQVSVVPIQQGMKSAAAAVRDSTDSMSADFRSASAAVEETGNRIAEHSAKMGSEATEARHALHGLGEEIGIHVPRFVQSFVAHLGGVGPALASAFSVIAVIGLIQVLAEIPEAIQKGIDSLTGWDAEAKKAYGEAVKANLELQVAQERLNDRIAQTALIGKTGLERLKLEMELFGKSTQDKGLLLAEFQRGLKRINDEVQSLEQPTYVFTQQFGEIPIPEKLTGWLTGTKGQIEESKKSAEAFKSAIAELQKQLQTEAPAEKARIAAEAQEAARKATLARAASEIEAWKTVEEAKQKAFESEVTVAKTAPDNTPDKSAEMETAVENENFRIQQEFLQKRLALLQREGPEKANEARNVNAQIEALEIEHTAKLDEIRERARLENLKIAEKEAEDDAKYQAEELAKEKEFLTKRNEEKLRAATEGANQELEAATRIDELRLRSGQIGITQWGAMQRAALEKWAAEQRAAVTQAMAVVENLYGKDSVEYQKLQDQKIRDDRQYAIKKQQIDEQIYQRQRQMFDRVSGLFNNNLNSWIKGQERFGQAMMKSWLEILDTMIMALVRGAEEYLVFSLIMKQQDKENIISKAYKAAADAYASAGNPFLGTIEAAIAFAQVSAFAAYAKGGIVPDDSVAQLHRNEMVLPAQISSKIQGMVENENRAGGGRGGGDSHVHLAVHAMDQAGVQNFLDKHSGKVARSLKKIARNGAR